MGDEGYGAALRERLGEEAKAAERLGEPERARAGALHLHDAVAGVEQRTPGLRVGPGRAALQAAVRGRAAGQRWRSGAQVAVGQVVIEGDAQAIAAQGHWGWPRSWLRRVGGAKPGKGAGRGRQVGLRSWAGDPGHALAGDGQVGLQAVVAVEEGGQLAGDLALAVGEGALLASGAALRARGAEVLAGWASAEAAGATGQAAVASSKEMPARNSRAAPRDMLARRLDATSLSLRFISKTTSVG